MISFYKEKYLKEVNRLLESLNYQLSADSFNNKFLKVLLYIDDEVRGVIVYTHIYDRAEIEYICVLDKYRKQGIGTSLIKYIEDNKDIKNITLEVKKSNEIAINFYKKNGFRIAATRKNYYNGEDAYLMIKEIGD